MMSSGRRRGYPAPTARYLIRDRHRARDLRSRPVLHHRPAAGRDFADAAADEVTIGGGSAAGTDQSMQQFLARLLSQGVKGARVVHHTTLAAEAARYGTPAQPLPPPLARALAAQGIGRLYAHQAQALDHIRAGTDLVVATPTASGKSLIYNLAVLEQMLDGSARHALYLFPIKALSRDQLDNLNSLLGALNPPRPIAAGVYDGDTSSYQRTKLRQSHPQILLTNPDMLHYALLAYHPKWEAFWAGLRFVVIDEMHTYRGVFGSHVAQILRRMQRICRHYGSRPQFILLSATIANPEELAGQLLDLPVTVIRGQGAPQAVRHLVFLEAEAAVSGIASRLLVNAAARGLKTIVFTQSRRLTEMVHMSVQRMAPRLARRVSSYRAGFLPSERRTIEQALAAGDLAGVISTSALELGIDIGGLDLCVLAGYPGTVMNTWQRGGRVGRGGQESAIVMIPQQDALDQYIIHHPRQFLESRYEAAVADPANSEILKAHLPCAAAELPLTRAELEPAGGPRLAAVRALTERGELLQTAAGDGWVARSLHPHRLVDLRSVGAAYTILTAGGENGDWVPLGRSEGSRALKECHPGAIYLHRGESYQVTRLDLEKRIIQVERDRAAYFTRVKSDKETEILETIATKPVANFLARLGRIRVTEQITGYEKRRLFSQELLDFNVLELPPQTFDTIGFWIEIEAAVVARIQAAKLHFMGGIHALEHAAISMFPLFAVCDRNDIGGISIPHHPQLNKAAVFIYDGYPGGIGLAAKGYELILPLLQKTRDLIESCECTDGCPACIHSPKCGAGNKPLDKQAAIHILHYLLGDWPLFEGDPEAAAEPEDHPQLAPRIASPPPPRIGFFDLETQRLANEVGGWQNKHLMRVSVAVLAEDPGEVYHVYREDEVPQLVERLRGLDLIVGFNIKQFDYGVLKAYSTLAFERLPTFDILEAIQQRLGYRLSLDHLAQQNLGANKLADGLQAVRWFREGNWDPLIRYCKEDVALTRRLFLHALEQGYLLHRNRRGQVLRIPTPWRIEELLKP